MQDRGAGIGARTSPLGGRETEWREPPQTSWSFNSQLGGVSLRKLLVAVPESRNE